MERAIRALNAAFAKQDMVGMRRLMADDHVSITPSAGMMDRETQLKDLPRWKVTQYKEADLKVTMLSKETARVTYRLTVRGTYRGKPLPEKSYAVSIWVKRDGRWQEACYQETPIAAE